MSDLPPRRFRLDDEDDAPIRRRRRPDAEADGLADDTHRDDQQVPSDSRPSKVGPLLIGLGFGLGIGLLATVVVWVLSRPGTESVRPNREPAANLAVLILKAAELENELATVRTSHAAEASQQRDTLAKAKKELDSQRERANEQSALVRRRDAEVEALTQTAAMQNTRADTIRAELSKRIAELQTNRPKPNDDESNRLRGELNALKSDLAKRPVAHAVGKPGLTPLVLGTDKTCRLFPPGYEAKVELLSPLIYSEDKLIPREARIEYDSENGRLRTNAPEKAQWVLLAGTVVKVTQQGALPTYHQLAAPRTVGGWAKKPPDDSRTDHAVDLIGIIQPSFEALPVGMQLGFGGDCTIRVGGREVILTSKGSTLNGRRDYPDVVAAGKVRMAITGRGQIYIDVPLVKGEGHPDVEIVQATVVPASRVKAAPEQPVIARFEKASKK